MADTIPNPKPQSAAASELALAQAIVGVLGGRAPAALATVVGRSGSAPQILGAKLLMHQEGQVLGTVGGGAIEAHVLEACRAALRTGRSRMIVANLGRDLGMCCGGAMEVFVEFVQPEARLILVGAGHIAQAIAPMARVAGFRVVVVDDRDELLAREAFDGAQRLAHDVDGLEAAVPDPGVTDYIVIVTRDHNRDERALDTLVRRPHRYLGMIGSRTKVQTILRRVLGSGQEAARAPVDLSHVRAPIGLALGGSTPGEIAVSVLAEIVAERHGGCGDPMSMVADLADGRGRSAPPTFEPKEHE